MIQIKEGYFIIIMALALVGISIIGNTIHEYSHYFDYHNLNNVTEEELCVLNLPTGSNTSWNEKVGYYKFNYLVKDQETFQKVDKYTELKAHTLGFIPYILFIILIFKYRIVK